MIIRNEIPADFKRVEEITRKAFWDLYVPGCNEHFVAHKLRDHQDFIPELDFVVEQDGAIIGNIMYSKSYLLDDDDNRLDIITFGPVCILPEFQGRGIGSKLITHSIETAKQMGHKAIMIFGNPNHYCRFGFRGSKNCNIATPDGKFPSALLGLELVPGVLKDRHWRYFDSDVFDLDPEEFEQYEAGFEKMKKGYSYTQELFSIFSQSFMQ